MDIELNLFMKISVYLYQEIIILNRYFTMNLIMIAHPQIKPVLHFLINDAFLAVFKLSF